MVYNLPAFQNMNHHKEVSWGQKAHGLIIYNISASFATSLVKMKSLLLTLVEEDTKKCL